MKFIEDKVLLSLRWDEMHLNCVIFISFKWQLREKFKNSSLFVSFVIFFGSRCFFCEVDHLILYKKIIFFWLIWKLILEIFTQGFWSFCVGPQNYIRKLYWLTFFLNKFHNFFDNNKKLKEILIKIVYQIENSMWMLWDSMFFHRFHDFMFQRIKLRLFHAISFRATKTTNFYVPKKLFSTFLRQFFNFFHSLSYSVFWWETSKIKWTVKNEDRHILE